MKLREYFEKLKPTAFGPWLEAFKKLFSPEELEQDIIDIYPEEIKEDSKKIRELRDKINEINVRLVHVNGKIEEKEIKEKIVNIPCKALLIQQNGVKEVAADAVSVSQDIKVEKYKANINLSFNKICNKQMEDFYELTTHFPKDPNKQSNYLQDFESSKGYNPKEAFKEIKDKNKLYDKFKQSANKEYHDNFTLVAEGANGLSNYIDHFPQETLLIGKEDYHITSST